MGEQICLALERAHEDGQENDLEIEVEQLVSNDPCQNKQFFRAFVMFS